MQLDAEFLKDGAHVLDGFTRITCGGLLTALNAGFVVTTYTDIEIDDTSRGIERRVLGQYQEQFPCQLPDSAIVNFNTRLPQNIQHVTKNDLIDLILTRGNVHLFCAGWQRQSSSMAGKQHGMDDTRFELFYDMVRILNFLQREQFPQPYYLFENIWPGHGGQYPRIDKAMEMIESFLGVPIVVVAGGQGFVANRVRNFWTKMEPPKVI